MQRVEKHVIKFDKNIDHLSFLSKNLYNYCNYQIRQTFIETGKMIGEYDLVKQLRSDNQVDFRALPSATSGVIIKVLFKSWKGFFAANKDWKKNPSKCKARPKLPNYKDKLKGRNVIIFSGSNQVSLKDGYIHLPAKVNIKPIKTNVTTKICEVRIVPKSNCYIIEIVYEKEKQQHELTENTYLSIDLGLSNFATAFDQANNKSFIVNGRPLKSMNQFFNKERAKLMSYVGDKGSSNRIKKLTHKRNMKIENYIHESSRYIVNYCIENKISNIVIGNNKEWKQEINLGKKINQNFVSVPFATLISQIQYKSEEVGINVIVHEESYTSKIDHYALEPMKKQEKYLGKRSKRGLFKSSTGKIVNADVNGAIGILRKVVDEKFFELVVDRGQAVCPFRIQFPNKEPFNQQLSHS